MRLITLNTWAGRSMHPLMRFFRKRAPETDVFCLQEVHDAPQASVDARHPDEHLRGDLFAKIAAELRGFEGSFARFEDDPERMSLAVFVRRGVLVRAVGDFVVYVPPAPKEDGSFVLSSRKLQHLTIDLGGRELLIANFHGLWNGGPKTDTPERLEQSRRVREFLERHRGPSVLCGDFNLLPDTESLRLLAEGRRDLVREYGVKSTRTPLYRHYENPAEPNFADYVLPTPDLAVRRFGVLPDLVSDHAPLAVEFET
jgi:endonuclease/exonuclease/phosphatase family metal-dependent hydrolase